MDDTADDPGLGKGHVPTVRVSLNGGGVGSGCWKIYGRSTFVVATDQSLACVLHICRACSLFLTFFCSFLIYVRVLCYLWLTSR